MPRRIHVVENDTAIRELLHEILEAEGYEVSSAATAPATLGEIEHLRPNLLILDYTCIAKWGEPVGLNWLPAGVTSRVPLLLCTAAPEHIRGTEAELHAAGFHLVTKPFDIDVLLEAVSATLPVHLAAAAN